MTIALTQYIEFNESEGADVVFIGKLFREKGMLHIEDICWDTLAYSAEENKVIACIADTLDQRFYNAAKEEREEDILQTVI